MISMITGTLDPDGGEVFVDGERVTTQAKNAKRKIGYVPQELALYDEINAYDNLRFFGALYGLGAIETKMASARALELSGLTDRAQDPVKTFSGGMKRRLNIAVALLHDPELLVFDEPTVGVDPQSRNSIFETLLRLADQGKTIVYTTHYMEEVEKLCQRVAVMDHGKVVAIGMMADLHRLIPQRDEVIMELVEAVNLRDFHSLTNTRIDGRHLTFEVEDLARDLATALKVLAEANVGVVSVRSHAPSLEEVFLHLTGRTLRD